MENDVHIDMMEVLDHISENKANALLNRAILDGDSRAMSQLIQERSTTISFDPRAALSGPSQVESLLRFVVDNPLGKEIEDAEADNIVYDALGDHRILGKKKKTKKSIKSY